MNVHTGAKPYVCQVENGMSKFNHKSNFEHCMEDVDGKGQKYLIFKRLVSYQVAQNYSLSKVV